MDNREKSIVIYHISNHRKYVLVTFIDGELFTYDITLSELASRYRHTVDIYKLFKDIQIDEYCSFELINFLDDDVKFDGTNRDYLEQIIHGAQILIGFRINHSSLNHVAHRVNYYHKYIRHRKVTSSDIPMIFRKFVDSLVIPWINKRLETEINNKSDVMKTAYMRALVGLYYCCLKRRIRSYNTQKK